LYVHLDFQLAVP